MASPGPTRSQQVDICWLALPLQLLAQYQHLLVLYQYLLPLYHNRWPYFAGNMAVAGLYDIENKQSFGTASLSARLSCVWTRYAEMTPLIIVEDEVLSRISNASPNGLCGNEYYKRMHVRYFTNVKRIPRGSWTNRPRAPPET